MQGDKEGMDHQGGAEGTLNLGGDMGLVDWGRASVTEGNVRTRGRRSLVEKEVFEGRAAAGDAIV